MEVDMTTVKSLQNTPIYSITEGKQLGEIKDLYLDNALNRVVAVHLGKEGIISRKALAIERSRITLLGLDAWFAADSDAVTEEKNIPELSGTVLVDSLRGRIVATSGGTKIGEIGDVLIDSQGRVTGFSLWKVHVQGPIAERKSITRTAVTSLGDKESPMIVDLAHAEEMPPPA
jgi:uncharacterized protein YrrD